MNGKIVPLSYLLSLLQGGAVLTTAPHADIAIHPNQGEIISCDQSGAIKIWDLAADSCTHELVGLDCSIPCPLCVFSDVGLSVPRR